MTTELLSLPAATPAADDNACTPCASEGLGTPTTRGGEDAALTLLRIDDGLRTWYRRGDGTTFYTHPGCTIEHNYAVPTTCTLCPQPATTTDETGKYPLCDGCKTGEAEYIDVRDNPPELTPEQLAAVDRSRERALDEATARMRAAPYLCHACAAPASTHLDTIPLCAACADKALGLLCPAPPANPRATLMALVKDTLEEWKECGVTTPYDVELAALARAVAMDGQRTITHICGEALAYDYCKAPAAFLARFDSFGAKRQAAITHAVAAWMGKTAGEVDQLWLESRELLQNAAPAQG